MTIIILIEVSTTISSVYEMMIMYIVFARGIA